MVPAFSEKKAVLPAHVVRGAGARGAFGGVRGGVRAALAELALRQAGGYARSLEAAGDGDGEHCVRPQRAAVGEDLSPKAKKVIKKQGVICRDIFNEYVTSIVEGADCVFTYYDENGCCRCAIEKAFKEGKIDFCKPISCHLYPVRITQHNKYRAVNYNRRKICQAAIISGKKQKVKVYQFLKEPLILKFGKDWYEQLSIAAKELSTN